MRASLGELDSTVGDIFADMNDRYYGTYVEQTDALPPLTSNTTVRIGINVQRNYTPFTLSGGSTIGSASSASSPAVASSQGGVQQIAGAQGAAPGKGNSSGGAAGGGPSAGGNASSIAAPASGSNDVTVLMEVHRLANFNLVGGAMAIHVPTFSITSVPEYATYGSPTQTGSGATTMYTYSAKGSCNGGAAMLVSTAVNSTGVPPAPALYYCYQKSQTSGWQPAGMAGAEWFLFGGRDYFSRGRGALPVRKNWVPSLLLASSVTSLGSAFLGPNFEPLNGLDIFAGYATAHQSSLPSGVSLYNVYTAGSSGSPPTVNTATHLKGGVSFGIGFDLSAFLQVFGKTQAPSLP